MNKIKPEIKKKIIPFPEDDRPKRVIVDHTCLPPLVEKDSKSATDIKVQQEVPKPQIDFSVPTLNSILCVKTRVEEIEEKKKRYVNDVEARLTNDEKITKQMNYPFDKKLYKELISLKLSNKPVLQPSTTISHGPNLRDQVPRLENFFTPQTNFEYSIPVCSNLGTHTTTKHYDGLRLHKVMRTWSTDKIYLVCDWRDSTDSRPC